MAQRQLHWSCRIGPRVALERDFRASMRRSWDLCGPSSMVMPMMLSRCAASSLVSCRILGLLPNARCLLCKVLDSQFANDFSASWSLYRLGRPPVCVSFQSLSAAHRSKSFFASCAFPAVRLMWAPRTYLWPRLHVDYACLSHNDLV